MSQNTANHLLPVSIRKLQIEQQHEDPDLRRLIGLSKAHENIQRKVLHDHQHNLLTRSRSYVRQRSSNESSPYTTVKPTTDTKYHGLCTEARASEDSKAYATFVEDAAQYDDNSIAKPLQLVYQPVRSSPAVIVTEVSLEPDDDGT